MYQGGDLGHRIFAAVVVSELLPALLDQMDWHRVELQALPVHRCDPVIKSGREGREIGKCQVRQCEKRRKVRCSYGEGAMLVPIRTRQLQLERQYLRCKSDGVGGGGGAAVVVVTRR